MKKFLEVAKYYNQEKYTIFRLLAYSGIRIGECLALTWHDLDYKNNTITINKTLARTDKGITIQTPKTKASNRVISLDVETIQILKSWQLEQRKQLLKIGINSMNKHQLIFNSNKNSFIFSSVITYDIKQIAKKPVFIQSRLMVLDILMLRYFLRLVWILSKYKLD
ncbi:site-specific integrase [Ligilactobacillus salivarius]